MLCAASQDSRCNLHSKLDPDETFFGRSRAEMQPQSRSQNETIISPRSGKLGRFHAEQQNNMITR